MRTIHDNYSKRKLKILIFDTIKIMKTTRIFKTEWEKISSCNYFLEPYKRKSFRCSLLKMASKKRYVVWKGVEKGIFTSRDEVKSLVVGFPDAKYKSFPSPEQAQEARIQGREVYYQPAKKWNEKALPFEKKSIAVDAACSSATGVMEYQGIDLVSWVKIFSFSHPEGTSNIGEFLALVHGLVYLKENKSDYALYSDSRVALKWVREKRCNTSYSLDPQSALFALIKRAEFWLEKQTYHTQILKRNTEEWWEIPADFGRK